MRDARQIGNIYRYKVWNAQGILVFISGGENFVPGTTLAARHGRRHARAILEGKDSYSQWRGGWRPLIQLISRRQKFPIKNAMTIKIIGVLEEHVDETDAYAFYAHIFCSCTEAIVGGVALLAGGYSGLHGLPQNASLPRTHKQRLCSLRNMIHSDRPG